MMNKLLRCLSAIALVSLAGGKIKAQIAGTFSVPGTYSSIASAIQDLNTQGVNGPVTILISAGYTETAPVGGLSLTATGTSANPIIFQKNGSGANPQIVSYAGGVGTPSTAVQDGVWSLIGSDYITIDGIDIFDGNFTNPATMEYGFGLFKASATDGCQNNTIKNCSISLRRDNFATGAGTAVDGSRGIDVVNATISSHTTALTITAASGANSNNKFYSNNIQNCNIGISLIGFAAASPFTFADTNNDIGGASSSTGNSILNYGGGVSATTAAAAVRTLAQYGLNVSYNTINNNNGGGFPHNSILRGIYVNTAVSANVTINSNTLTINSGTTTSQVSVIENVAGGTGTANIVNINNNVIANGTSSTTSGVYYGIYSTASSASLTVSGNTFTNNSTNASSGSNYLIYNTGAVSSAINITGNSLGYSYTGAAAYTGIMYNIYNGGGSTTTNLNISNNNFVSYNHNITGTGTIYFIYNTNSSATLNFTANNWNGLTMNHSGAEYFMYNSSNTQSALAVVGNTITNITRNAAAGTMYGYYAGSSSLPASTQTFSNNLISNITATISGSGLFYGIYNSDGATSPYPRKTVTSNTITNINYQCSSTCYGLFTSYLGDGSGTSGSQIFNNTVSNITTAGTTYAYYVSTITSPTYPGRVYGNTAYNLSTNGASSSIYGVYLGASGAGVNFYKNRISDITANGATGVTYGLYATTSPTSNIYNNLIGNLYAPTSSGLNQVNGIYVAGGTNINIYFNSVYVNATSTGANFGTNAIYATTTPSLTLRNNLFVNNSTPAGTGLTTAYRRSSTTLTTYMNTSNNNAFYAGVPTASNVIYYDGTASGQTLGAFQAIVTPRDASDVSENPAFVSTVGTNANFLNLNTVIPTQLESAGTPVSGITDDYAGTTRNVSTPDVGAWEGNYTLSVDLTPPSIGTAGFTSSSCNTSFRTFTVNIVDGSGVATGSLSPRVYYAVNAGPYTSTAGTLTSGTAQNGIWTFSLSYTTIIGDVISYFTVAQDVAPTPNLASNPGPGFSATNVNSVTSNPTTPNTYTINTTLNGIYTVGATGNFTTFTQAANAYNVSCLSGPVTFSLTDPSYSTNETFPIVFLNNTDASATNSLLVIPAAANAATIAGSGAAVVKFLNARYITIDGSNAGGSFLLNNQNTGTSAVAWLASTASTGPGNKFITIKNSVLRPSANTSGKYGIISGADAATPSTAGGIDNDNVSIQNNTITTAYYGLYATGTATAAAGGFNNWDISGNRFGPVATGTDNIGYQGIYLTNGSTLTINNNTITNVTYGSGYPYGINMAAGLTSATVNLNTINAIRYTGTGGYGGIGIDVASGTPSANITIQNNMISDLTGDGWSGFTAGAYAGIRVAASTSVGVIRIQNNSIALTHSNTIAGYNTAVRTAAIYFGATASNVDLRNNLLYSNVQYTNTGAATYAIYSAASATAFTNINYNNYYVEGTQGVLGYIAAANQANIPAIQTAFGQNANSQNIQPFFVANNDLHLTPGLNAVIDNLGSPIAGITIDIDGQTRNVTTPDIGADEFTAPTCTSAIGGTLATSSYSLCNAQVASLTSNSVSTGATTIYQWMVSTTPGGPYSNVTGGTGANFYSYTTGTLSPSTLYYVLQVTCGAASVTAVSNEATVAINPYPTAYATTLAPVCAGQSVAFTSTTDIGTGFTWTGPASFTANTQNPTLASAPANGSGNYTLVVAAANCTTSTTTSLTVNSTSLTITANPPALCLGSSATLTAVGNATSVVWSNSLTTTSFTDTPSATTVYSATATGTSGCTANAAFTLVVTNPTIAATNASVCLPNTGSLTANAFAPVNWYASPTSTTVIGTGNTFTTNAATTTTYYAQAASTSTSNMFVSLAAGNSFLGNMFDIVALSNIEVNGFNIHVSSTIVYTVEVWTRTGSFVGFNTSNTGWTMAGTTTVTGMGTGTLTPVPMSFTVPIAAGQTQAFYVTITSGTFHYTNGTAVGAVWVANSDMQLLQGNGGGYFSVTNSPRCFNGEVLYTKTGCTSPMVPAVLTVNQTPTITASATSPTVCQGGSTPMTVSGANTYSWSTGSTATIIAVTPSVNTTYSVIGDNGGGCTDTALVAITVNSLPTVSLSSAQTSVCVNGSTVSLNGTPTGGAYTGVNVSGSSFNPGSTPGTYTPSYAYTDPTTGCSNSATMAITVSSLPSVSLTATQYTACTNSGTILLSGSPAGGIYAGSNASSAGVFTPGASQGTFASTYSYTNSTTGCSNTATTSIVVSICTGLENQSNALSNLMVYPNPNYGEFTVELRNGLDKEIQISDVSGRLIQVQRSADDMIKLNIAELSNGIYMVKILSNNSVEVVKIVKQ